MARNRKQQSAPAWASFALTCADFRTPEAQGENPGGQYGNLLGQFHLKTPTLRSKYLKPFNSSACVDFTITLVA